MSKEKVILGLSGGVDSSVAGLLLKQKGYEVEALFMRNWDSDVNFDKLGNPYINNEICPQEQDFLDASLVAQQIGIKLSRVDFVEQYWNYVFKYFIDEYSKGRTPNPDILCNKYIKFKEFLDYALNNLQASKIAMGHYAGVRFNDRVQEYELYRGKDQHKDQTYFLCQLSQKTLSKIIFPLVDLEKSEIRQIAELHNLATATKKDSTGICFIGERNFTKFLQNYIPNQPGTIIDITTKEKLGTHIGTMYYTIGQRKGLNLGGMEEPYYVVAKDIEQKIIYVSKSADSSYLYSSGCVVNDFNWINTPKKYFANLSNIECTAKFRYRQSDVNVAVEVLGNNQLKIKYIDKNIRATTIGQFAVLYLNDVCLGGGVIDSLID